MIRVLVILRGAWRNDNNIGNTMTDIFAEHENFEIYSLCMRDQTPQNDLALQNFAVSEQQLIRNLLHKSRNGRITEGICNDNAEDDEQEQREKKIYDSAKKTHSFLLEYAREAIWSLGGWKNEKLRRYIREVSPDVIFMPVFRCFYPFKILNYIQKYTNAPVVLFHADDNYTLRHFSWNPLFWLYRFRLRHYVRGAVRNSAVNYVISEIQKRDYEKAFGVPCKILTKSADFTEPPQLKTSYNTPLQLVFTGNIGTNRWKSLAVIAQVLQELNQNGTKAELRIYTATPLTAKMQKALNIDGTSYLMGAVPASAIPQIQSEADMLVHVEALDLKNKLAVRQSFSTKLVDYFKAARPILAVGPKDVASIDHLLQNNCALVADNAADLAVMLSDCLENPKRLHTLAENAFLCGKRHHNAAQMKEMLCADLKKTVASRK